MATFSIPFLIIPISSSRPKQNLGKLSLEHTGFLGNGLGLFKSSDSIKALYYSFSGSINL